MTTVLALSGAESQLIDLYNKFEDWREGLGDSFDNDYRDACSMLATHPEIGPRYEGRLRRLLMLKWQIGLFYAIEGNRVLIHAALDVRQSPENIRRRLGLI